MDLGIRAGTSASSIIRLEKGEPGVGIGTLAVVLVVFGLAQRLGDLIDIRKDDLGLALANAQLPKRGRSFAAKLRAQDKLKPGQDKGDVIDPDGVGF